MEIIDICNMALGNISRPSIASLEEHSEAARQCKLYYQQCKQELLSSYSWSFAKRLTKLAELSYKHPRWQYVYVYPERCLNVRKLFNEHEEAIARHGIMEKPKFEVFLVNDSVKAIGTDLPEAYAEYTYDVQNEDVFSRDFIKALSCLLAHSICLQLTGNSSLAKEQLQMAYNSLAQARYQTAMEQYDSLEYPNGYFNSRG